MSSYAFKQTLWTTTVSYLKFNQGLHNIIPIQNCQRPSCILMYVMYVRTDSLPSLCDRVTLRVRDIICIATSPLLKKELLKTESVN